MERKRSLLPDRGGASVIWGSLAICALTALAYLPALRGGFVWDDDHFLTQNPLIRAPDGLYRFWCTAQATDYWPVTSTSLWVEWRWWGMNAAGYHITNLALHIGSALLLWAVLRRLLIPGAFLAALVFALHPVNVESVAWITQRKNLLALVFFLASIYAFLKAERVVPNALFGRTVQQRVGDNALHLDRWYALSLLAFGLAMLSKGSAAPLPLVLLGVLAWRRPLARSDFLRLAPFFIVSAALAGVDIWFQRHGSPEIIRHAGFAERILSAGAVVWFYLSKAVWPIHLSFCYPQWELNPATLSGWLPLAAMLAGLAALWRVRCQEGRPVLAGLGYFLVMLVPVLGLTDVYFMKYSLVADHYQHLAIIGVIGLAAAGWEQWRKAAANPALPVLAACVVVGALGVLTWRQCGNYRDRPTLFRSALRENPNCWMAHNNLGLYLIGTGQYPEAMDHCLAAVRLQPGFAEAHNNLGIALASLGRLAPAVAQFQEALALKPFYPEAYNNLGNAYRLQRRLPESIDNYLHALRLNPRYAEAHNNLGVALMDVGRLAEAISQLEEAVRIAPAYRTARENLALALRKAGQNR